jgi:YggT family protein
MAVFLTIIRVIIQILTFAVLIRSVLSWIMPGQKNLLTDVLFHVTEPVLAPLRKILPSTGNIDFSPFAAIVILQIISFVLP